MKKIILASFLLIFSVFVLASSSDAATIDEIKEKIKSYEQEVERLNKEAKTLSLQIAQFDTQIKLTTLKIEQTQEQILLLGGRIDQIEISLDQLTLAFSSRAVETYKMARLGDPVIVIASSPNLSEVVLRFHYLKRIQESDRNLLVQLQETQTIYQNQKEEQETLEKKLEEQKNQLAKEKRDKANLLTVTKSNERRYQELLASARAELAVVLGQGKESFLRDVKEGDVIGRVIASSSGCSSGQHLHFEVHQGGTIKDPSEFLRPISFKYSYNSDQYGYFGTINPRGSWNWPMREPIEINQGFGSHGFAKTFYPGGAHNGIDLDSSASTEVMSVKPGKLYGGSYQCGGRYPGVLLYAKVEHGDGTTAWYLHMTPL